MEGLESNKLKEKRGDLLLALGEEAHKVLRQEQEVVSEKMKQLSEEIKVVDIEINHLNNPIDKTCCPKCHRKLAGEEAFCRECGFAVQQFFAAYVTKCECCGVPMKGEQNYCSVCGTKRKEEK